MSGLLAALDSDQPQHEQAAASLAAASPPLLLSPFVLAELDYMLLSHVGAAAREPAQGGRAQRLSTGDDHGRRHRARPHRRVSNGQLPGVERDTRATARTGFGTPCHAPGSRPEGASASGRRQCLLLLRSRRLTCAPAFARTRRRASSHDHPRRKRPNWQLRPGRGLSRAPSIPASCEPLSWRRQASRSSWRRHRSPASRSRSPSACAPAPCRPASGSPCRASLSRSCGRPRS